ncbi:hypothetical protein CDV50_01515 [Haematobacter massiliensis]|uniref:Uncharacterized protein n=1 Tax=Haematobacter massiliensis TaxID=195105 RepID=A0A086XYS5_9RHOB|nr:hypothetical protein [Haematobacter massiliensis]KFI27175.1 hypothetical protein CN97_01625 [Haematobacter massiliensis]OWJ73775.1 hypothetical protein CDV50_01515 [Haematobacter massiliensis]OWJ82465.1 hypothetical protein CDV51_17735 [Haematobacter massiliensis]QBJ23618.1 hypothetical protein HmaOT1_04710 [Haematobacter massiliensis]
METSTDLQLILHVRNINGFLKTFLDTMGEGLSPDARTQLETLIDASNMLLLTLASPQDDALTPGASIVLPCAPSNG